MAKKRLRFTEEELRGVLESEHARGYKQGLAAGRLEKFAGEQERERNHHELLQRSRSQAIAAKAIGALAALIEEVS